MQFQPIHGVFSGYPSSYPIGTSKTFNVRLVDQIVLWLSGIFFDTDSPNVFSTGSYVSGVGITEGLLLKNLILQIDWVLTHEWHHCRNEFFDGLVKFGLAGIAFDQTGREAINVFAFLHPHSFAFRYFGLMTEV